MTNGDIHNRQGKIDSTISKLQNQDNISEHNREILLNFKQYLLTEDLSKDRISRHLYNWRILVEHVDFRLDEADKSDLLSLVGKINRSKITRKDSLADTTKAEYRKSIRKLYKHYLQTTRENIDGEALTDFFTVSVPRSRPDPDRLPRPKHVKELIRNANRARDKAFIAVLWGSAGRVGEVLGLKWKDVLFQDDVAKLRFRNTKTNDSRTVPLLGGYLYLKKHKQNDHRADEPEAFIFRSLNRDEQLSYQGGSMIIDRAEEKADLPTRIKTNPHAFRKGRATYLAGQGMNQASLCEYGGWVQGSDKVAVYVGLAESEVEAGLRRAAGQEVEETEEEEDLKPVVCHECAKENVFEAENCERCGAVLETSELFTQVQVEESTRKLNERIIKERIGLDDEKINEHAKQIVAEEMDVDLSNL